MEKLIKFVQQISESVLPYKYFKVLNNPYIKVFRLISCISVIILFLFKSVLNVYLVLILYITIDIYILYQCVVITLKIYYTLSKIIKDSTRAINYNYKLSYYKIIFNTIRLIIVLCGIPIISDTVIEIVGDIKYVIKQILFKKNH